MAETSGFFNAELVNNEPDRSYEATDFANYYANLIGNGVFANPTNQLQVYADTENTNSVKVKSGNAYINGYWYKLSEDMTIKFEVNSSSTPMWYGLNLQLNLTTREISIIVVSYPKSNTKPEPVVSRTDKIYELCLAQIKVKQGERYIQNSDIYDLRFNENYCGIVAGLIKQISTENLFSQYGSIFSNWLEEQRFMLEKTPAGKLQAQILNLSESQGILDCKFDQMSGSIIPNKSTFLAQRTLNLPDSVIDSDDGENYDEMVYYTYYSAHLYEYQGKSDFPYLHKNNEGYNGWGNFFRFYNEEAISENAKNGVSIQNSGRYKITISINGDLELMVSDSDTLITLTPGAFLSTYVRNDNMVMPVGRKEISLTSGVKKTISLNLSRNFVFEVSEEDISLIDNKSKTFLRFGYFINTHGDNGDIKFFKLPTFDVTIEPIKLNVGIPQDLIGFVNVTKEEYDTLVSEGKATQDTLYFVQNNNKIEMYLGEIKLSGGGNIPVSTSVYTQSLTGYVSAVTKEEI